MKPVLQSLVLYVIITGCGGGGDQGFSADARFSCCLNGSFYACPDDRTVQRCAGFAQNFSGPDPSGCAARPEMNEQCRGSNPSSNNNSSSETFQNTNSNDGCSANATGRSCSFDEDCGYVAHCYGTQCYSDRSGSPCFYDDDCGYVSSCVNNCCN